MKKFNINHYVYIQITDDGWKHLSTVLPEDYINHCIKSKEVVIKGEPWWRLQMHEVFSYLPQTTSSKLLFNTNIMFDDEHLTEP